jgi:hypothetical protein
MVALLGPSLSHARAWHCGGWSVGLNFGIPVYYRPYYPCYGPYYAPYPVYVAPPPVIVQPAPLVQPAPAVQPAPVAQQAYQQASLPPAPVPLVAHSPVADSRQTDIEHNLQLLSETDDRVRTDAVLQLGRLKAQRALDPLAATLSGDRSPTVREAAARALGVISSPKALPALQQAAQTDGDRNVRYSAQFAIDVIQAR